MLCSVGNRVGEGDLGPGGAFFGGVAVERGSPSVCSRECDFVCLFWTVRTGILKNTYKYFEGAGRCLECVQILKVCANMLGVRTHILVGAILCRCFRSACTYVECACGYVKCTCRYIECACRYIRRTGVLGVRTNVLQVRTHVLKVSTHVLKVSTILLDFILFLFLDLDDLDLDDFDGLMMLIKWFDFHDLDLMIWIWWFGCYWLDLLIWISLF